MTADRRLIAAREYLDAVRPYKVSDRPHSVLVREAAELRRMLGQVLDVIGQSRVVLGQALGDAIAHREPGLCEDCEAESGGLCYDHAGDLDKADAYLALAGVLGIEVER